MTTPRTAFRTAAVLGATAALTLAGAGAASATTAENTVVGNTVSVTFTLEAGQLLGDACGALLAPTSAVPELTAAFANADNADGLQALLATLTKNDSLIVFPGDLGTPLVSLVPAVAPSRTVTATNVPSNVYALVSFCGSDDEPTIDAPLIVGNPAEALTGSLSGLGGDALGMLSSAMGGDEDGGMGGDPLGSLAGMMGGATE
ncbi:hypothetical protein [Rhodococcus sp. IEGM 1408]|uniref:hypothetical protein n=1 Tax=Rhodococcus sp. IEGM 1408 TaxID=3082220 RepID=UPI002953E75D|nr:hypothetical protein [Rhodococcus sp. IEGM 1408]MDV8002497.1 hypothetical protein [Rhodococcus sp. IEGM 1408]